MQTIFVQGEISAPVAPEQKLYVFIMDPPGPFGDATSLWNGTHSQQCLPFSRNQFSESVLWPLDSVKHCLVSLFCLRINT